MNKRHELIKDESQFSPPVTAVSTPISFSQALERRLLISPDTKKELIAIDGADALSDGLSKYSIVSGCPVLYPSEITEAWQEGALPLAYCSSALKQYVLLSQIKQAGEINAPLDSVPARKHPPPF